MWSFYKYLELHTGTLSFKLVPGPLDKYKKKYIKKNILEKVNGKCDEL